MPDLDALVEKAAAALDFEPTSRAIGLVRRVFTAIDLPSILRERDEALRNLGEADLTIYGLRAQIERLSGGSGPASPPPVDDRDVGYSDETKDVL